MFCRSLAYVLTAVFLFYAVYQDFTVQKHKSYYKHESHKTVRYSFQLITIDRPIPNTRMLRNQNVK